MAPKIFIDGEHGTTGLQIVTRLAGRSDIELMSMPAEQRRDPEVRKAVPAGGRYCHPVPAG
jgi:N-acetyl-gamma-glutamyl-phosphate reductase